jgi:hypothetical protein
MHQNKVEKGFRSDEPKVRAYQRHYVNINAKTGAWAHSIDPHDAVEVERKGTSWLRRRPKYNVTFVQSKGVRHNSKTGVGTGESIFPSRVHINRSNHRQLGAIAAGKGDSGTVNGHKIKVVRKSAWIAKADDSRGRKSAQTAGGAALGVGGTVALGSHGVARTLEHEGRKWSSRAEDELAGAQRIAPKLGGSITSTDPRYAKNPRVPDVRPATANAKTKNMSEHYMKGKTKMEAEMAGKLRGQAGQSRYFAGTYGSMAGLVRRARKPAIGLAAAGAGGIALSHAHRRNVGKSAFDRELTTA